jgi:hypothetical protein
MKFIIILFIISNSILINRPHKMDEVTTAVELLLNISRDNISSGNANEALGAIIHAITISHPQGEAAIM